MTLRCDCLDSCLDRRLDNCLDSCLDSGLDSCLDSCLDRSLAIGLDGDLALAGSDVGLEGQRGDQGKLEELNQRGT